MPLPKDTQKAIETRQKMSLAHIGLKYPNRKAKTLTKEHKNKISLNLRGRIPKNVFKIGHKQSEEVKNKIRLTHIGKKHSKETIEKIRLNKVGKKANLTIEQLKDRGQKILATRQKNGRSWFPEGTSEKIRNTIKNLYITNPAYKESIRKARLLQVMPFKDTLIEIKLQNLLKENGIIFETHYPISGQPDIFIKPNICIFADGCYWHKCSECGFINQLKNEKDTKVTTMLQSQGYVIIRLWEHEINKNLNQCFDKIKSSC